MPRKNPFKLEKVSIRLVKDAPLMAGYPIHTPDDAACLMGDVLSEMDREVLAVINLKSDGTPINCSFVSIGAIDRSIAHPREMMKAAILSNASNMILVHNHPSGSLPPSEQDTILTDRMMQVCDLLGIELLDHIIVGGENKCYFSFREKGIMPMHHNSYIRDYQELQFETSKVAEPKSMKIKEPDTVVADKKQEGKKVKR